MTEEGFPVTLIGMTIEEAARSLRVSARTIQDMVARGELPARMVGNKWRISPKALDEWLAGDGVKPSKPRKRANKAEAEEEKM